MSEEIEDTKPEEANASLFDLEFHESANVDDRTTVARVIGGWIYTTTNLSGALTSVFVPEPPIVPIVEERDSDETDEQIINLLTRIAAENAGGHNDADYHLTEINRLIRVLRRRSEPKED